MLKNVMGLRAKGALCVLGAFASSAVFAAGFEKNALWSGKYQGFGGAATSSVNDSEALFFNPAGLGFIEGQGDIRLNFSPTFSEFSGPVSATQTDKKSELGFSPVAALTSAYKLNNKFVVGVGAFVSGGTNTEYEGITAGTGAPITDGKAKSELRILDFTVGAATQVTKEFSLGVAWRATYATAELISTSAVAGGLAGLEVTYKDLKAWDFSSFRAGAQYRGEKLGVGLNVRTAVPLTLKGSASARGAINGSYQDADITSSFPFQVALGTDYKFTDTVTAFGEISWTNYAANKKLEITVPGSAQLSAGDIELKWHDQWVGRIGAQWQTSDMMALRAGYVYTSKVTSDRYARATFSPPGIGHTLSVGSGFDLGAWDADVAVDYSLVRGDGTNLSDGNTGDFTTDAITAHLGVAYTY